MATTNTLTTSPADAENDRLNTITLSYTFYPVRDPAPKPLASGEADKRKGAL